MNTKSNAKIETVKRAIKERLESRAKKVLYDDVEHSYKLISSGKVLTSVSNTIPFYKQGLSNIPTEILEKAKRNGTIMHSIIEHLINHDNQITNEKLTEYGFDPMEHSLYLENAHKVIHILTKDDGLMPLAVEQLLYDAKTSVAGTTDAIFIQAIEIDNIIHVALVIYDWKTGNLRPDHKLQTQTYQNLLMTSLEGLKIDIEEDVILYFEHKVVSLKDLDQPSNVYVIKSAKGLN